MDRVAESTESNLSDLYRLMSASSIAPGLRPSVSAERVGGLSDDRPHPIQKDIRAKSHGMTFCVGPGLPSV
jgi:hypothetical protein